MIQAVIQLQLDYVIFESDSQIMVQAHHTNYVGFSELSFIISSINILLHNIPNFEVKFVKRQANSIVHLLAKAANSWTRCSLFNLIPPYIERQLLNEMH